MPKSRNRKNHKQKVAARNRKIQEAKNRVKNVLRKEIAEKYRKEQEAAELEQQVEQKLQEQEQTSSANSPTVENAKEII